MEPPYIGIGAVKFLSTPSARRATDHVPGMIINTGISIHALREEGDRPLSSRPKQRLISIHALREEGDGNRMYTIGDKINFYPRPPRGGRPKAFTAGKSGLPFLSTPSARRATSQRSASTFQQVLFLSTPSARRATRNLCTDVQYHGISIHALREEGDDAYIDIYYFFCPFLSTPSARRAT